MDELLLQLQPEQSQEQGSKSALSKSFNSSITEQTDGWNSVGVLTEGRGAASVDPSVTQIHLIKGKKIEEEDIVSLRLGCNSIRLIYKNYASYMILLYYCKLMLNILLTCCCMLSVCSVNGFVISGVF